MHDSQQKNSQAQLFKLFYPQNHDKYMFFTNQIPEHLSELLNQSNEQLRQNKIKIIYQQIALGRISQQLCINQSLETLVETLSKISVFGGFNFRGQRLQEMFTGEYIRLKIKHIQNISFSNLKQLNFYHCSLNSIQSLAWLDAKHLSQLWIHKNNIVSLKPFSKTIFLKLKELDISQNQICLNSLYSLQRSCSPKLIHINISQMGAQMIVNQHQILRAFVKFKIDQNRCIKKQKLQIWYNEQAEVYIKLLRTNIQENYPFNHIHRWRDL